MTPSQKGSPAFRHCLHDLGDVSVCGVLGIVFVVLYLCLPDVGIGNTVSTGSAIFTGTPTNKKMGRRIP
jgi:hypothetical protein